MSGNPLLQRSEVIRDVGPGAFDYGLLIGHEDFRLIRDETADIFVTFPHSSIQEFLGAFFLIQMLDSLGSSVDNIPDFGCKQLILLKKPLFFHFCLWFVYSDQTYFTLQHKAQIRESLVGFALKEIGNKELNLSEIPWSYSSLDLVKACDENDEIFLAYFKEVVAKCHGRKTLVLDHYLPIDRVLTELQTLLTNLPRIDCPKNS